MDNLFETLRYWATLRRTKKAKSMQNGSPNSKDFDAIKIAESQRRDTLCRGLCLTITILLAVFAIKDFVAGQISLASTLTCFAIANSIALGLHNHFNKLEFFSYYIVASSVSLCTFLVIGGGTDNTALYWIPCFPVFMFAILPAQRALSWVVIMMAMLFIAFVSPEGIIIQAQYTDPAKLAALGAFILTASFTYFQAKGRETSANAVAMLNHELSHIASTDELTNLANRRDMALRLEFESKRASRSKSAFSIILCDIDYFKKINDSFGHSVGDQALCELANILVDQFRSTDKVGRWGGEEFLIILPDTSLSTAIELADKMRKTICQASIFPNMPNRLVTVSCGVVSSSDAEDPSELLKLADNNLYAAKNQGRNRVIPTPADDGKLSNDIESKKQHA